MEMNGVGRLYMQTNEEPRQRFADGTITEAERCYTE
jgi:hypothetical protein